MSEQVGRTIRKTKRLRAHVDYEGMSVSYGRVKLGVPSGFKEMLEAVTKEILREQPKNIPGFLSAYFAKLLENQKKGCPLQTLVTERIVELEPERTTAEIEVQAEAPRPVTAAAAEQTEAVLEASTEVQTEMEEGTAVAEAGTQAEPAAEESTNATEAAEPAVTESSAKRHCSDTAINTGNVTNITDSKSKSVSNPTGIDRELSNASEQKSHTSVSSLSQIPDLKMVNCEVILKKSAEDLAVELEDTENVETENRAVANQAQATEAEAPSDQVQELSLEQQNANHYEYVDEDTTDEADEEPASCAITESVPKTSSSTNQEPKHYCPDEEEPIEELADIRPSTIEATGGELSLEQQGHIEYEDDTAEVEEAPAEEAPAAEEAPVEEAPATEAAQEEAPTEAAADETPVIEETATEKSSAQPVEEAAPAQEEYEPTDLETHNGGNDA